MKILFDHQAFSIQDHGGVSRYFYELFRNLGNLDDVSLKCPIIFTNNDYIRSYKDITTYSFFRNRNFAFKQKIVLGFNQMATLFIDADNFDVFHPTYYNPYFLKRKIIKPVVMTCHDMIYEKYMPQEKKAIKEKRETLQRAVKIIAVSESTKRDMLERYKMPEENIQVIHLASSLKPHVQATPAKVKDSENQYFFYVGHRSAYKNFIFFVKAIATLLRNNKNLKLYCMGGGRFDNTELQFFSELKIGNRIFHVTGNDQDLSVYYSNALAFFYPSLYEGFGIPILEAMSCGCPVAASNVSSLPEVGGDAVLYFDPADENSIHFAAESLLNNSDLRNGLIKKGLKRYQEFSWKRTAFHHYELYKSIT